MLDAEPDVAAAAVAEDSPDDHSLGRARQSRDGADGGGGARGAIGVGVLLIPYIVPFLFGLGVVEVIPEGSAEALLGGGGDWKRVVGGGGGEAGQKQAAEGVDLGHGNLDQKMKKLKGDGVNVSLKKREDFKRRKKKVKFRGGGGGAVGSMYGKEGLKAV